MVKNRKAQSTVEYAVLAAVVVGALLVMQIYMKRGVSGKLKEATDRVGEQFTPHTATYSLNKSFTGTRTEVTTVEGALTTTIATGTGQETQTSTGSESPANTDMGTESLFVSGNSSGGTQNNNTNSGGGTQNKPL